MADKKLCEHQNFSVVGNVFALTETEGGPVTAHKIEVTVACTGCGIPFGWQGLERGLSPSYPTTSFDGLTLRAPIRPAAEQ